MSDNPTCPQFPARPPHGGAPFIIPPAPCRTPELPVFSVNGRRPDRYGNISLLPDFDPDDVYSKASANARFALKSEMSVASGATSDRTVVTLRNGLSATVLSAHQPLDAYVNTAEYDATNHKLLLKHDSAVRAEIDMSVFINSGMISTVEVSGGNLVIVFNTEEGTKTVQVPLVDIFNPEDYYTKTAADAKFVSKAAGKGLSTNDYTDDEKTKLAGIATGAQANAINTVRVNGTALLPDADKAVDVSVPAVVKPSTDNSASGKAADAKAAGDALVPMLLAQYYPGGDVVDVADLTGGLQYTFDTVARTALVKPFSVDRNGASNNSSVTGRVVIPPFVDESGNPCVLDDGTRFRVTGIAGGNLPPSNNSVLTFVVAPTTVVSLGEFAFCQCVSLVSVSLPAVTGDISLQAFYGCTVLASVSIPSAKSIGYLAFGRCPSLKSAAFPAVTGVGMNAFSSCSSLESVSLPAVSALYQNAFSSCASLKSVYVPSVTGLGYGTFASSASIEYVDFGSVPRTTVPTLDRYVFYGVSEACKIIVPDAQYDAWIAASGWSELYAAGYRFLKHSEWEYAREYELGVIAPEWAAGSAYSADDVVRYNGVYYYAMDNIDVSSFAPSRDPDRWSRLDSFAGLAKKFLPRKGGTMSGNIYFGDYSGPVLGDDTIIRKYSPGVVEFYNGGSGFYLRLDSGAKAYAASLGELAPSFDPGTGYAQNALCVYDAVLYRCTNVNGHTGAWNADDFAVATVEDILKAKADKVANATSGNLAKLDANGNLADSGVAADDVVDVASVADIAPDWTSHASIGTVFDLNELCSHHGGVYRCILGYTVDEAVSPSADSVHWVTATVEDVLSALRAAKYEKPSGGIPAGDLASAVQTSLGKADTAVQSGDILTDGKIKTSLLPSYVDDVLEYAELANFPATGEEGKIYVAKDTNKTYRWSGTAYVEISASLALGETSSTAYRGDRGKTAYDHATDANRLTTAQDAGLYKIATTAEGHVKSVTAVAMGDITALGIPGQDTTYSAATPSVSGQGGTAGLMSAADKEKLNGVAAGAEVNAIATVKVNGTALTPDSDKAVDITVPTGSAASKDVPTSGDAATTEVVMGNDSRLSDARTPTAHKSSHAAGGSDAIAPSDIGAAASSHTHSASDITSGLATVATTGSYNDLSGKPTIPTVPTNVSAFTNDAGYLTAHQDITGKADKVANATSGNLAALDANGNLADSGKKAGDFLPKTGGTVNGDLEVAYTNAGFTVKDASGNYLRIKHDTVAGNFWYLDYSVANVGSGSIRLPYDSIIPADVSSLAGYFNGSTTYTHNSLCINPDDGRLYRCVNPNGHTGAWVAADFELATVEDVLSALRTAVAGKVAANAAITGATKCKITYDSKGLVTGGADLALADIPDAAIHYASGNQNVTVVQGENDEVVLTDRTFNTLDATEYDDTDTVTVTLPAAPTAASGKVADVLLRVDTGADVPTLVFDENANVFIAADDTWATLEASSHNVFSFTSAGTTGSGNAAKRVWIVGRVTSAIAGGS